MNKHDITSKSDIYIIFECNHEVLNPQAHHISHNQYTNRYICPVCNKKRAIKQSYIMCQGKDCSKILYRPNSMSRREFCNDCRIAKNREQQRWRNQCRTEICQELQNLEPITTLDEIAQEEGITREGARQIITRAVRKFKANWRKLYGEEPIFNDVDLAPDKLSQHLKNQSNYV